MFRTFYTRYQVSNYLILCKQTVFSYVFFVKRAENSLYDRVWGPYQFGIKILKNVVTNLSRRHLFTYVNKPSYLEFREEFRLIIYYSFVKNVKLNNFLMYHESLNVIKFEIMRFVYSLGECIKLLEYKQTSLSRVW